MELTTEKDSNYKNLYELSLRDTLKNINAEDQTVPMAVKQSFTQLKNAEDNIDQAWKDLLDYDITNGDIVVGVAASGILLMR